MPTSYQAFSHHIKPTIWIFQCSFYKMRLRSKLIKIIRALKQNSVFWFQSLCSLHSATLHRNPCHQAQLILWAITHKYLFIGFEENEVLPGSSFRLKKHFIQFVFHLSGFCQTQLSQWSSFLFNPSTAQFHTIIQTAPNVTSSERLQVYLSTECLSTLLKHPSKSSSRLLKAYFRLEGFLLKYYFV